MKKILSMILVLALVLSLAACGGAPAEPADVPETTVPAATNPAPVAEEVKGVTIPNFAIMINGVKVDNVMMAAYPTYSVTANSINSSGTASTTTYVGFALTDVLAAAGLTENYIWLEATADDGYAIEVTGEIVTAPTTLLAVTKNGEQFKVAPWFAPCSSGTGGASFLGRWVLWLLSVPCGFWESGRLIPALAIHIFLCSKSGNSPAGSV